MKFPKGTRKTLKGAVNVLANERGVEIDVYDKGSGNTFVQLVLTPEQFCRALSRETHIECDVEVAGLELVGLRQEIDRLEFPLPSRPQYDQKSEMAAQAAQQHCPEGWTPDLYFGSQDSFFERDGEPWARCVIRRWVEAEDA